MHTHNVHTQYTVSRYIISIIACQLTTSYIPLRYWWTCRICSGIFNHCYLMYMYSRNHFGLTVDVVHWKLFTILATILPLVAIYVFIKSTYQYHFSSYTTRVSIWWLNDKYKFCDPQLHALQCRLYTFYYNYTSLIHSSNRTIIITNIWLGWAPLYDQQQNLSSCLLDTSSLIWLKAIKVRAKITSNMLTRTYEWTCYSIANHKV